MEIKKGQLIAITSGEYSDYCLRDHMRALVDFDSTAKIQEFKDTGDYLAVPSWGKPGAAPEIYGADDRFIAWAVKQGLIEPLEPDAVVEWHIGSYGRLE
jgi:hypothetical protein